MLIFGFIYLLMVLCSSFGLEEQLIFFLKIFGLILTFLRKTYSGEKVFQIHSVGSLLKFK